MRLLTPARADAARAGVLEMNYALALGVLAIALVATPALADVVDVAGQAYVDAEDASVWQESNGIAGLQRVAGEDADGRPIPADTRVA